MKTEEIEPGVFLMTGTGKDFANMVLGKLKTKRNNTRQLLKEIFYRLEYFDVSPVMQEIINEILANDKAQREEIKQLKAKLKQQEADK